MFERMLKYSELIRNTVEKNMERLLLFAKEQCNQDFMHILDSQFKINKNEMIDGTKFYDAKFVKESFDSSLFEVRKLFEFFEQPSDYNALDHFRKTGDKDRYEQFLRGEIEKGTTTEENLTFLKKSSRIGLYHFFFLFFHFFLFFSFSFF